MALEKHPLISVVMPVYNQSQFVAQALNSILNQTYPNVEIIIIDDGSKDRSSAVVEDILKTWTDRENAQRKIHFIKQDNQGAHVTINRGLSMSQGDWLTILNSDDYYHPDRLQILFDQTTASNSEISFTGVVGIDEKDRLLSSTHEWQRWYEETRIDLFNRAPTIGFILLEHNFAVSPGNLFFSRQLLNEIGPFRNFKLAHDLDFILRALPLTEPLFIRENLYFYRIHSNATQHLVGHPGDSERAEMYSGYLCHIYPKPPKNPKAPCHWYWPTAFAYLQTRIKMHKGLEKFIIRDKKNTLQENTFKTRTIPSGSGSPITLISHELSLSGAPKLVADLAHSLKGNGFAPRLIALKDGPMRQEFEKHGISVYVINQSSKLKEIQSLLYAFYFQVKGDVIVNSVVSYELAFLLLLMRPWTKLYWYIHESFTPVGHLRKNGIRDKLFRKLLPFCNRFLPPNLWFGSEKTRRSWDYSTFPEGKVLYWSGIPKQAFQRKNKASLKHFLSVGTASLRKGTETLIDAFLLGLKENRIPQDATLTIIGFPNQGSDHLEPLCDMILKVVTSDARNKIRLIENLDPEVLETYYQEADVYVQSSVVECMPLALLTAMSKGLPIVTTHVDGCSEAITEGETGYLCFPYQVQSLLDAMAKAVNQPKQSQMMGLKAYEKFNAKFSLEVTQERVLAGLQKSKK